MFKLRDYQKRLVEKSLDHLYFNPNPGIVVAPVGSGKSLIIGSVAKEFNKPLLVLQPSKELLEQNISKLRSFGGEATIYSASAGIKEMSHLVYATLGSVASKVDELKKYGIEYVLIDEAHKGYSPDRNSQFMKFIRELNPKSVVGYTATPLRLNQITTQYDSFGILNFITNKQGKVYPYFKTVVDVVQVKEVADRYWSKLVYKQHNFDDSLLGLNSTGNEFTRESIANYIKLQNVNNRIYLRLRELLKQGRKNILVFVDSVETAEKFTTLFDNSAFVSANTLKRQRSAIIQRFKHGDIKIVFNHSVLTTGFDHPLLDTIIIGKPTNSYTLYYQMAGRGVRVHPDKKDCLIEDFGGNIDRFGKLEDLTIERVPKYGWVMFSGDFAITDYPLNRPRPTREFLYNRYSKSNRYKIWFGKYKGKTLREIPVWYLEFILNKFDFKTDRLQELKTEIEKILNK